MTMLFPAFVKVDEDIDMAYICFDGRGGFSSKVAVTTPLNDNVMADFSSENRLVGIELMSASMLPKKMRTPGFNTVHVTTNVNGHTLIKMGDGLEREIPIHGMPVSVLLNMNDELTGLVLHGEAIVPRCYALRRHESW